MTDVTQAGREAEGSKVTSVSDSKTMLDEQSDMNAVRAQILTRLDSEDDPKDCDSFLREFKAFDAFADFSYRRLLGHAGGNFSAFAETEKPLAGDDGSVHLDRWYWLDDNGKELELLSAVAMPGEERDRRKVRAGIAEFIMAGSPAPFIFRRTVLPMFKARGSDSLARISTAMF